MDNVKEEEARGPGCPGTWEHEVDAAYTELMAELQEACENHVETVRKTLHMMIHKKQGSDPLPGIEKSSSNPFLVETKQTVLDKVWRSYELGQTVRACLYILVLLSVVNSYMFAMTRWDLYDIRQEKNIIGCLLLNSSAEVCADLPVFQGLLVEKLNCISTKLSIVAKELKSDNVLGTEKKYTIDGDSKNTLQLEL